jgi:hypothetical protein
LTTYTHFFILVFIVISSDGNRKEQFLEHFPEPLIQKWKNSSNAELREVMSVLKELGLIFVITFVFTQMQIKMYNKTLQSAVKKANIYNFS